MITSHGLQAEPYNICCIECVGEKYFHHVCGGGAVTVDVLINPLLTTLHARVGAFLVSCPAHYRHLVYAGLAHAGSGAWLAQDGLFTFSHLREAARAARQRGEAPLPGEEAGRVLALSVFGEGEWTEGGVRKVVGGSGAGGSDVVVMLNPGMGKRAELDTAEEGIIKYVEVELVNWF